MKIVKSLKYSGLLLRGVSQTIQYEAKEQKRGFLGMLLGTLSGSLLGNMLVGKGAIATRNVILRVSLGTGVTDRGQKRVKHQQCSDKAKTSYLGIFWGGEFDEIDNIWWNWKFRLFTSNFCRFRAPKMGQNCEYFQKSGNFAHKEFLGYQFCGNDSIWWNWKIALLVISRNFRA